MVQKILVAIEKSENSKEVFSQALSLAKDTGAVLHLVHVLSTDEKGSPIECWKTTKKDGRSLKQKDLNFLVP
jgi:nucleotide-binding universal stress UspA family protein